MISKQTSHFAFLQIKKQQLTVDLEQNDVTNYKRI